MTSRLNLRSYRYLIVVLAVAVSVLFQGSRGLYETTEGRYAEAGREMIETGNYLEPTLGYRPHWTKPPLTYWAIAGGLAVFGNNAWGARFFNIVAFLVAVWAVYYMGMIVGGPLVAILAALIYLSSILPVAAVFAVTTDTLLTMWELLGVMAYLRAYTEAEPKRQGPWVVAMWCFFGLGFLTKGLPALFPLLVIGLWQFLHPGRTRLTNFSAILLFVITAFSWGAWAIWKHPDLLDYYISHEIADRLSSHDLHNSAWYKPFTIYFPALLFAGGPWLFIALYHFFKKQYPVRRKAIFAFLKSGQPLAFSVFWVLLPLTVFCIVKSRLVLYVLPLYAPLVLLAAYGMSKNADNPRRLLRFAAGLAGVLVVLWIGGKGAVAQYPVDRDMKQILAAGRAICPDALIAAYERQELYGMQFYTDGRMKRVSRSGREPWADCSIAALLTDFQKKGAGGRNWLILFRKRRLAELNEILQNAEVFYRITGTGKWRWVHLAHPENQHDRKPAGAVQ